MRKIQILRGTFAKKPNLEDGQMYLAKDTKQVFVGDKAIAEGEIEFANKSDLTALTDEVNTQATDIADIQADYAQTTGGNTVAKNSVVISDTNGKLTALEGSNGYTVRYNSTGPVAVKDNSVLMKEKDFENISFSDSLLPIVYDGTYYYTTATYKSFIYRSKDMYTWEQIALPSSSSTEWNNLTYGNGVFVLSAEAKTYLRSVDGVTWTQNSYDGVALGTYDNLGFVKYSGDGFYAGFMGMSSSKILYSTDALTWTQYDMNTDYSFVDIAYAPAQQVSYVTIFNNKKIVWGGKTFESFHEVDVPFNQSTYIVYTGKLFVVQADRNMYTIDVNNVTTTLNNFKTTGDGVAGLASNGSGTVIACFGNPADVSVSTDNGTTWVQSLPWAGTGVSPTFVRPSYVNNKFVIQTNTSLYFSTSGLPGTWVASAITLEDVFGTDISSKVKSALNITPGITSDEANAKYLQLSGGTMTGKLSGIVTPTADTDAVPKSYVDTISSNITNIEVSETQPTNQKVGDFWYRITGTV